MNLSLIALALQGAAPAEPVQDPAWHNRQQLELVRLRPEDGWRMTPSGVRWRRVKGNGTGQHPATTDRVTVHYAGRFIDGTEFDSSIARGEPVTFRLAGVVKGWREGVPMAGVGDTIELVIPAELAYGFKGKGPIPGGATLVFTVQLIAIAPPTP